MRRNRQPQDRLEALARQTIREEGLLPPGSRVVAAVSGGADSVALLHLLCRLREEGQIKELFACHLNHGLRGEEALRDEEFVRELCRRRQVPLTVRREEIAAGAKAEKKSLELYARERRYAFFEEEAARLGAKVATAHTLSDQVETVLFRLARGTALHGMEGIRPARGPFIRPLIRCTRQEVEDYCRAWGLRFVTDSTNLQDQYSRNWLRHQVVPALQRQNPDLEHAVERFCRSAAQDEAFLQKLAGEARASLTREGGRLCRKGLMELDPALQGRVLSRLLEEAGAPVGRRQIEDLLRLCRQGSGAQEMGAGLRARASGEELWLEQERSLQEAFCVPLFLGKKELFPGKTMTIRLWNYEEYKKVEKNPCDCLKNAVDYDRIEEIAVVRQRQTGDRVRFAGQNVTKSLKKLFIDRKIPLEKRQRLAILADQEGPLWVEGFGPAQRGAVTSQTRRLLLLRVEDNEEKEGSQ